jgi:hypothetical protein
MTFSRTVRGISEPLLTDPSLPPNLLPSIQDWIKSRFWIDTPFEMQFETELLRDVEREMGVSAPFDPSSSEASLADLLERVAISENFAIRLLAILVRSTYHEPAAQLAKIFEAPGSKWEVIIDDDVGQRLSSRLTGPTPEAIQDIADLSGPAHRHLVNAMNKLTSPDDSDPWIAYQEAVKAVEAAAQPIVVPNDSKATLGKINGVMRATESDWMVVLGRENVADVIRRSEILWTTDHERHGSDDPPPPVTPKQAQAAFALALGLVDYFARGLIFRVTEK